MQYSLPEGYSLGLKIVHPNGDPVNPLATPGFKWNVYIGGETVAPDWDPTPEVGGGLHVWEWAQGDLRLCCGLWKNPHMLWMAIQYRTDSAVHLRGTVKIPKGVTVTSNRDSRVVSDFIRQHTPANKVAPSLFDEQIGDAPLLQVGDAGRAWGTRIVKAGDWGFAQTGNKGYAEAGDFGFARAGEDGIAIVGWHGTAVVGAGGKAKAGMGSQIQFQSGEDTITCKVGEGGVEPDTFYKLDDSGKPVMVDTK